MLGVQYVDCGWVEASRDHTGVRADIHTGVGLPQRGEGTGDFHRVTATR